MAPLLTYQTFDALGVGRELGGVFSVLRELRRWSGRFEDRDKIVAILREVIRETEITIRWLNRVEKKTLPYPEGKAPAPQPSANRKSRSSARDIGGMACSVCLKPHEADVLKEGWYAYGVTDKLRAAIGILCPDCLKEKCGPTVGKAAKKRGVSIT